MSHRERPPLAVVGGGPSVLSHLEELRGWPGDVWACGSAFHFCEREGIRAAYFGVDPQPESVDFCRGASKAIVCSAMDRIVFEELKGADLEVFDLVHTQERTNHGATTATAAPELAVVMGYRAVTFFGCESSFEGETHAYRNEEVPGHITVVCNGERFRTHPAYCMQSEYLATMIRLAPNVFSERSGGLLGAMVQDISYRIEA